VIEQAAVGRLLAFGLQPRLRAAREPEYGELLRRYRDELEFRQAVSETAEGQGLVVLGANEQALTLAARDGSPYSLRLEDYTAARGGSEERLLHGLIQLALAAYVFPSAQALEDSEQVVRVSARRLDRYLRELCELIAQTQREEDPRAEFPELEQAYRVYLRRQAVRETPDGRGHMSATIQMTRRALDWLEGQGLVRRDSEEEGGTYQVLGRYRTLVRELAGHHLLDDLTGLQEGGSFRPDTSGEADGQPRSAAPAPTAPVRDASAPTAPVRDASAAEAG
jgi:hypothetical protein